MSQPGATHVLKNMAKRKTGVLKHTAPCNSYFHGAPPGSREQQGSFYQEPSHLNMFYLDLCLSGAADRQATVSMLSDSTATPYSSKRNHRPSRRPKLKTTGFHGCPGSGANLLPRLALGVTNRPPDRKRWEKFRKSL